MFLLVSGRHVGAHTDGRQRGVSIQISINLAKKFLRISRIRTIAVTRILASLCIFTFFHFPDSGLYLSTGFDFYFDLFWIAWHWKPAIARSRSLTDYFGPIRLSLPSLNWDTQVKFNLVTSILLKLISMAEGTPILISVYEKKKIKLSWPLQLEKNNSYTEGTQTLNKHVQHRCFQTCEGSNWGRIL